MSRQCIGFAEKEELSRQYCPTLIAPIAEKALVALSLSVLYEVAFLCRDRYMIGCLLGCLPCSPRHVR